jgi:NADH-quinone oxidoreductase subunit D
MFSIEKKVYEIYEEICGACLTTNMGRIGGFERDWSQKHLKLDTFLKNFQLLEKFENI